MVVQDEDTIRSAIFVQSCIRSSKTFKNNWWLFFFNWATEFTVIVSVEIKRCVYYELWRDNATYNKLGSMSN